MRASDLGPGDVFALGDDLVEVVTEPLLVHRGISPFDELQLLAGVSVRGLRKRRVEFCVWPPDKLINLRRRTPRDKAGRQSLAASS